MSETGRIYLVTTTTRRRVPLFADFHVARAAITALRDDVSTTLAFVLMPDHLHWLLALRQGNLSAAVGRYKQRAASAVNARRGRRGEQVWQPGFHDHTLRVEEDLEAVARYVVANPVRAGLARSVREYPHWDAVWL